MIEYSNTLVLIGHTCSGKTTLAKELEKLGYERIITYTTRPIRPGEIDGIDYHFITEGEFEKKITEGFFAEVTHYNANFGGCYYGSAKSDYLEPDKKKVIVLNPRGVRNLTIPCTVVYLDAPKEIILKRAMLRGDSIDEVERRYSSDKIDFDGIVGYLVNSNHNAWLYPVCEDSISQITAVALTNHLKTFA